MQGFDALIQSRNRQRVHPVIHHVTCQLDRRCVVPATAWLGIEPDRLGEGVQEPLYPHRARFVIPMFDTKLVRRGDDDCLSRGFRR